MRTLRDIAELLCAFVLLALMLAAIILSHGCTESDAGLILRGSYEPGGETYYSWDFEDSQSDYVTVTDNAAMTLPNGDWTIAGWIKINDNAGSYYQYIFSWGAYAASPSLNLYVGEASVGGDAGKFFVYAVDGSGSYILEGSATNFSTSATWQHIVVNYSSSTIAIYCNTATVMSTGMDNGGSLAGINPAANLGLGSRISNPANRYYDGQLSMWAKWDRSLTSGERSDLYNCTSTPDELISPSGPSWYIIMDSDYDEEIVPLTVTNSGSSVLSENGCGP